jgi:hypothetical protein
MARNAAIGDLALSTGLRLQEFTFLLPWEIPALPPSPTMVPISFVVPAGITKGRKLRTTRARASSWWARAHVLLDSGLTHPQGVRSARAAVSAFRPVRFPVPPPEPFMSIST